MKGLINILHSDRSLQLGVIIISVICLFSILVPILSPYHHNTQNLSESFQRPSWLHPLGTDFFGRDLFTRLMHGGRITLAVAFSATLFAVIIGTIVGLVSGFIGGWPDRILMRLVDILLGFPKLFVILLLVGMGYTSLVLVVSFLALFSWMEIARIVRSDVWVAKEQLYVKSAEALGLRRRRIIFRHILPNITGPLIVSTVLLISTLILIESSLSFLGLGVQPPNASWGTILNEGRVDPIGAWWISAFSGIIIVACVIGFNLIGDGLRNILDPKSGKKT